MTRSTPGLSNGPTNVRLTLPFLPAAVLGPKSHRNRRASLTRRTAWRLGWGRGGWGGRSGEPMHWPGSRLGPTSLSQDLTHSQQVGLGGILMLGSGAATRIQASPSLASGPDSGRIRPPSSARASPDRPALRCGALSERQTRSSEMAVDCPSRKARSLPDTVAPRHGPVPGQETSPSQPNLRS